MLASLLLDIMSWLDSCDDDEVHPDAETDPDRRDQLRLFPLPCGLVEEALPGPVV